MDASRSRTLPLPEARTAWAGQTKDRLVAKASVESSPEIERLVNRAVARAKQGDREAVRFLYFQYADNVYGYVRTIVCDHHDAEDVTQQVFAKLLTVIHKYEDRGLPFVGWLMRMSHNAAVDAVRARRETPAEEIYGGAGEAGFEERAQVASSLREAIAALPDDQREVVVMRHVMGLTPLEIADRTGRTNSSVYGLHHRGRRALCDELRKLDSVPAISRPARVAA
jgi:RNA polymerase sigma-70 factor (ECF subfamily)